MIIKKWGRQVVSIFPIITSVQHLFNPQELSSAELCIRIPDQPFQDLFAVVTGTFIKVVPVAGLELDACGTSPAANAKRWAIYALRHKKRRTTAPVHEKRLKEIVVFRVIHRAQKICSRLDEVLAHANASIGSDNKLMTHHSAVRIHRRLIYERPSFAHDAFFVEADLAEPFECFDLALHCRAVVVVRQWYVWSEMEQIETYAVRFAELLVHEKGEKLIEVFDRSRR